MKLWFIVPCNFFLASKIVHYYNINIFADPAIPENLQISTEIGGFSPPERETSKTGMPRKLSLKNSFGFGGTNVSLLFAEHAAY